MLKFAVIDINNTIINVIIAETKEIAEEVTGNLCIDCTSQSIQIGGTFDGEKLWSPQPYLSWVKNQEKNEWEAPIELPLDGKKYKWDEETISWVEVTE